MSGGLDCGARIGVIGVMTRMVCEGDDGAVDGVLRGEVAACGAVE